MATEKEDANVNRFDGETIVKSERYKEYANLLDTILEPDKEYSYEEIDKLIKKSLANPVKVEVNE